MKKALKHDGRSLPANAETTEVLEPRDRSLDLPSSLVASKWTAVLCLVFFLTIAPVWSDHFDPLFGEFLGESIVIVGLVTDESFGNFIGQHEFKELLNERALMRVRRCSIDGNRKTARVDHNHDFHAFPGLCASDSVAATSGFSERSIDEALVDLEAMTGLYASPSVAHDVLKYACFNPLLEPPVNRALATELRWKILPLRTIVQDPEDSLDDLTFVNWWTTTTRITRRIRNPFTKPIELFFRECQQTSAYESHADKVLG